MAAFLRQTDIEVERTGVTINVPNNDIARLMYYMQCVCTSIDCNQDPDIQRFTNYHNWAYLSIDEQKALILGCYTFSPDVFDDKVFFHSDALCRDSLNEFYTVSQVRHQILAVESIVIAGRARQVNNIMTYKIQWMRTYYFEPMERLTSRFNNVSERTVLINRQTYVPVVVSRPIQQQSSRFNVTKCICYCVIIVIIIAVISSVIRSFL